MTEDEKRITNVEKRVDNLETKYLKVKFDVHFKRTLAKFDNLGMKLDNLDNQIQRCTKLMIWLFVLSIFSIWLANSFMIYTLLRH